jgi:hypothetical protein
MSILAGNAAHLRGEPRELHAMRLTLKQIGVPVAALRIHQHFLSKESANRPDSATGQSYIREKRQTQGLPRSRCYPVHGKRR